ncbi:MAG TPA: type II secretion system protein GspE, partial [Nitrospirota bacterium]|nr:type II secretion system protein GspE [Nitrospirota bacterium]
LSCILAQRLLKRICSRCKVPSEEPVPADVDFSGVRTVFKGAGCDHCHQTGYFGQVGVFEFLPVTPKLKRLIAKNASEDEVWETARADGMRMLFEDAIEKINDGITTLEEVMAKVPNIRRRL